MALTAVLTKSHTVVDTIKQACIWKIPSQEQLSINIRNSKKKLMCYTFFCIIFSVLIASNFIFPSESFKRYCYTYELFEKYSPRWQNELSFLYGLSFIITGLTLPANCNQIVYGTNIMLNQSQLILNIIEKEFKRKNITQQQIEKLLCFAAKRGNQIMKFINLRHNE